jgi:TPR repeat protein
MTKLQNNSRKSQKSKASELFERGFKEWKRKNLRPALRLFLAAAQAGDKGAQVNVGYFYDKGIGIRRNRSTALYWYKRAYRRGDSGAANNIATICRDEQKMKWALSWFKKAVNLGDDGSNLEIAKHYLRSEHDPSRAIGYLDKVCRSNRVAEVELEEANRLLKEARRKLKLM